jgi:hypothetical protein
VIGYSDMACLYGFYDVCELHMAFSIHELINSYYEY